MEQKLLQKKQKLLQKKQKYLQSNKIDAFCFLVAFHGYL